MARYNKGANAERELIRMFWNAGFAVARTAGSGKNALPMPDLIVLGKGRSMVIEVKAWRNKYLSISEEQMSELMKWGSLSGAEIYVAWKYPNKGWFFISPKEFRKAKLFSLSFSDAQNSGLLFEQLIGVQSRLE